MHDHAEHDAHAPEPDHDGPQTPHQALEEAIRTLLIEKGVLSAAEISAQIEATESRTPALGAEVVARAWTDAAFKARLLAEPRAALGEAFGLELGALAELRVVENTPEVHNVVVCTLCSCYPRMLLGVPPAWYKSAAYRARVVREPRAVLREFGLEIAPGTTLEVHDSTADLRFLVLPMRPSGTESWSAERLAETVTRDCMIGAARPAAAAP